MKDEYYLALEHLVALCKSIIRATKTSNERADKFCSKLRFENEQKDVAFLDPRG